MALVGNLAGPLEVGWRRLGPFDAFWAGSRVVPGGINEYPLWSVIFADLHAHLLALPIVLFPFVFAADLYYWLYNAGHDLDPTAALSSSIKPFTPAILGEGIVGQFSTTAMFGPGWFIALAGAILAAIGIIGLLRGRKRAESS